MDEKLMEVYVSKVPKSEEEIMSDDETPEESGWTAYFEDSLEVQNDDDDSSISYEFTVSDAASFVECEVLRSHEHVVNSSITSLPKFSNKLKIIDRLTRKEIWHVDDSLEDTATSPVNSPKLMQEGKGHRADHLQL